MKINILLTWQIVIIILTFARYEMAFKVSLTTANWEPVSLIHFPQSLK